MVGLKHPTHPPREITEMSKIVLYSGMLESRILWEFAKKNCTSLFISEKRISTGTSPALGTKTNISLEKEHEYYLFNFFGE